MSQQLWVPRFGVEMGELGIRQVMVLDQPNGRTVDEKLILAQTRLQATRCKERSDGQCCHWCLSW
jgi:hypothetical protein